MIISKYFNLSEEQKTIFDKMGEAYTYWNEQINVVSRKDIGEIYIRHILHSLAIAKIITFKPETAVADIGCGGGFPGIPLAVLFPETQFTLIDSIGKKIKVVNEVAAALNLHNVTGIQSRSEDITSKFDFVVSRAVTAFPKFVGQVSHLVSKQQRNSIPNGIIYLKGGDFGDEIKPFGKRIELFDIPAFFDEEFFETKKIIYLPM